MNERLTEMKTRSSRVYKRRSIVRCGWNEMGSWRKPSLSKVNVDIAASFACFSGGMVIGIVPW